MLLLAIMFQKIKKHWFLFEFLKVKSSELSECFGHLKCAIIKKKKKNDRWFINRHRKKKKITNTFAQNLNVLWCALIFTSKSRGFSVPPKVQKCEKKKNSYKIMVQMESIMSIKSPGRFGTFPNLEIYWEEARGANV